MKIGLIFTDTFFGGISFVDVNAEELILEKGTRNPAMQVAVGREDRLLDDDGRHLIGTQFSLSVRKTLCGIGDVIVFPRNLATALLIFEVAKAPFAVTKSYSLILEE